MQITSATEFPLDTLLLDLISVLKQRLVEAGLEVAHLKLIGLSPAAFGVANLVSRDLPPELSLPSHAKTRHVELVVNARVACDPSLLGELADQTIRQVCATYAAIPEFGGAQMFRPGRPQPTHRMSRAGSV